MLDDRDKGIETRKRRGPDPQGLIGKSVDTISNVASSSLSSFPRKISTGMHPFSLSADTFLPSHHFLLRVYVMMEP